jgi:hypothetical protein
MSDAPVELANRHSRPKRIVLGLIGLVVLVWPVWDLWPGIASFTLVSPVFWVIGLGAVALGAVLLAAAIFGRGTVLTVAPEGISLTEETILGQRGRPVALAELGPVTVVEQDWSEGPATFRVSLARQGGKLLLSEDFPTRSEAEALANQLERALQRAAKP